MPEAPVKYILLSRVVKNAVDILGIAILPQPTWSQTNGQQ